MGHDVNEERLLKLFTKLVSIDSLSFGERGVADVLKVELDELGFEVTEDEAGKEYGSDTGNIYAILRSTDPDRDPVLLSAHMDTVAPGINKKAIIDSDEGIITSAGDTILGADDVAGIVEILEGVRLAIDNTEGHGDIEILFTIAEEVYGKGAKIFNYNKIKSRTAYVADMSGSVGSAARSAPSIISFDFEIQGKSAHAGFAPETGINAVAVAAGIIAETQQGLIDDSLTFNIGTISGGTASNIVSDYCKCTGEARGSDHDAAVQAVYRLEQTVRKAAEIAGASYTFNSEVMIKAYRTPVDDRACAVFTAACNNLGIEPKIVATKGGSDNNIFAEHGIRGIVISTGMGNTHSVNEFVKISDLEMGSRLIAEIISLS